MKTAILSIALFLVLNPLFSQDTTLLAAGPMPGYNTDSEATIWLQTKETASVQLTFWPEDQPDYVRSSETILTEKSNGFNATIRLEALLPETRYQYDLWINEQPVSLTYESAFSTQPPIYEAFDFRMATGSCAYIRDKQYQQDRKLIKWGGKYGTFETIADQQPEYMLWLGDNTYLREDEWKFPDSIYYRYSHTRRHPAIQQLLSTTHHIAIWDDHDYGPNNSNAFWQLKKQSVKIFQEFWPQPNKAHAGKKGNYTSYRIGDVELFLMDNRYFRSPAAHADNKGKSFLGREQLEWLINGLAESNASFKLVAIGSQVLSKTEKGEGYYLENKTEWNKLMGSLAANRIEGVIFLSGDRHYTELSRFDMEGFYPVYDLTVSPITSLPNPVFGKKNARRVKGTFFAKRNFAMLDFAGEKGNRKMKVTVYSRKGRPVWTWEIGERELRVPNS